MATDDKVSVILTSTNTSGAVKQKSFTYISPDATNGQLKTFAQAANALTENTYNGSRKVTQVDLDTADPGGNKQTATITLTTASISLADYKSTVRSNVNKVYTLSGISYDGDGTLYAVSNANTVLVGRVRDNSVCYITTPDSGDPSASWLDSLTAPVTVTIRADETDNYKAASVDFTITA